MTRKEDLYCYDFRGSSMYCDKCDERFNNMQQLGYLFCPFCGKHLKSKE